MASSFHDNYPNGIRIAGKPSLADTRPQAGTGLYTNGTKGVEQQLPRRLSFNGSDMELSDLKGDSVRSASEEKNSIDTKQTLIMLAAATTLAVAIKYLVSSFDSESIRTNASRATTMAGNMWQNMLERFLRLKPQELFWRTEDLVPKAEMVARLMYALVFGLLLSSFTWYIIYLDSNIPGVNPPTPFSASKKRYRGGPSTRERRFHLPYVTALLSGVIGFLIFLLASE
ncbi:uncharacterized protein LOC128730196 [Anopheles nili]|uniref:uncharacterized protein LOC128730196 n=1 Tax=Anopheles nili TaxID=185578 RepID=UPI00237C0639|nr:uncharacterized protein LOC128730196 [Anopheles nili]